MVDRYLSLKFGVNPLYGFRENDVYGRTTTDACVTTKAQSRAKNYFANCILFLIFIRNLYQSGYNFAI